MSCAAALQCFHYFGKIHLENYGRVCTPCITRRLCLFCQFQYSTRTPALLICAIRENTFSRLVFFFCTFTLFFSNEKKTVKIYKSFCSNFWGVWNFRLCSKKIYKINPAFIHGFESVSNFIFQFNFMHRFKTLLKSL